MSSRYLIYSRIPNPIAVIGCPLAVWECIAARDLIARANVIGTDGVDYQVVLVQAESGRVARAVPLHGATQVLVAPEGVSRAKHLWIPLLSTIVALTGILSGMYLQERSLNSQERLK